MLGFILFATVAVGASEGGPRVQPQGTVPPAVRRFEETVEDSYDKALAGRLATPQRTVLALDRAWTACRTELLKARPDTFDVAAVNETMHELSLLAARHPDRLALARAINAASRRTDRFFGLYNPRTPSELLRLDYLGRELDLAGLSRDPLAGRDALAQARETWNVLKPRVILVRGSVAATGFARSLDQVAQAIDTANGPRLHHAAFRILEQVDGLEKLFESAPSRR